MLRGFLRKLGIVLGTLVVVLVLGEIGLRLAGYATSPARYFDPAIGFRFHPHQRREMRNLDGTVLAEMGTNALGLRGPVAAESAREGVARIACLGDSWTFGWGVEDGDSYPARMRGVLGDAAEVLNFGMPGYNTDNELRSYRVLARPLAPDVVVLGFFMNDLAPADVGVPNTDSLVYRMFGRTALLEALHNVVGSRGPFRIEQSDEARELGRTFQKSALKIYEDPGAERWKPFLDPCLASLDTLAREVQADGARLLVALFPARWQVTRVRAALEEGEAREAAIARFAKIQAGVTAVAGAQGVPVLDLLPDFVDFDGSAYHPDARTHPSAQGYALIAERVAGELRRLEWL